jgi:hypothetical protein
MSCHKIEDDDICLHCFFTHCCGGLTYLTLDATFERHINFTPFGLPDGKQNPNGRGDSFRYDLGAN